MFERFGFIASSEEFDGDGIIYFEIWLKLLFRKKDDIV